MSYTSPPQTIAIGQTIQIPRPSSPQDVAYVEIANSTPFTLKVQDPVVYIPTGTIRLITAYRGGPLTLTAVTQTVGAFPTTPEIDVTWFFDGDPSPGALGVSPLGSVPPPPPNQVLLGTFAADVGATIQTLVIPNVPLDVTGLQVIDTTGLNIIETALQTDSGLQLAGVLSSAPILPNLTVINNEKANIVIGGAGFQAGTFYVVGLRQSLGTQLLVNDGGAPLPVVPSTLFGTSICNVTTFINLNETTPQNILTTPSLISSVIVAPDSTGDAYQCLLTFSSNATFYELIVVGSTTQQFTWPMPIPCNLLTGLSNNGSTSNVYVYYTPSPTPI